jgi:hypothetical protein
MVTAVSKTEIPLGKLILYFVLGMGGLLLSTIMQRVVGLAVKELLLLLRAPASRAVLIGPPAEPRFT